MKLTTWAVVMAGMMAAAMLLSGCQTGGGEYTPSDDMGSGPGRLSGTIHSRSPVILMPGTVVNVQLVDVSRTDGRADLISEQNIVNPRSVPAPFELRYDPAKIDPRHRYEVQVRVEVDGRLRWINTAARPVLTNGQPGGRDDPIEVWIEQISKR